VSTVALILALLGAASLAVGAWLLSSTGNAWRVARVLAAARDVPLAEVVAAAGAVGAGGSGGRRYLRTHGRVSSAEEFPDETQRPLVFRRTRLQRSDASERDWRTLDEQRLAVPFGIEERGAYLEVDVDALGDGLVVVPREARGLAAEMPPELAAAAGAPLPGDTPVRVRIDQISAVEHATVAGVVERGPDGSLRITAGMGRPLILTTVEPGAAMRLLASGSRRRVVAAAVSLAAGAGLVAMAVAAALLGSIT
jgi:hypothetical protein